MKEVIREIFPFLFSQKWKMIWKRLGRPILGLLIIGLISIAIVMYLVKVLNIE